MKLLSLGYFIGLCALVMIWTLLLTRHREHPANREARIFLFFGSCWFIAEILHLLEVDPGVEQWMPHFTTAIHMAMPSLFLRFIDVLAEARFSIYMKVIGVATAIVGLTLLFIEFVVDSTAEFYSSLGFSEESLYYLCVILICIGWLTCIHRLLQFRRTFQNSTARRVIQFVVALILFVGFIELVLSLSTTLLPYSELAMHLPPLLALLTIPAILVLIFRFNLLTLSPETISEALFYDAHDGVLILDAKGLVLRANPAAWNLLRPGEAPAAESVLNKQISAIPAIFSNGKVETGLPRRDGSEKHIVAFRSDLIRQEETIGSLLILRDVSEEYEAAIAAQATRENLEEQIQCRMEEAMQLQDSETMGSLSSAVAHDFNNLLAAIIGFSSAAIVDLKEDEPAYNDAKEIHQAAIIASGFVNRLLSFSRIQKATRELLDIAQVIADIKPLLIASRPENVVISYRLPEEKMFIMGNRTDLIQLLLNLCTNAFEAMPEGGQLRIEVDGVDSADAVTTDKGTSSPIHAVQISVSDTGEGMSEEVLLNAFEPFFSTRYENPGLGLATAERIASEHAATLRARSEEGRGSVFTLVIPRIDSVDAIDTRIRHSLAGWEHIMVVDDDTQLLRMSERLLTSLGYRVTVFSNPRDALTSFMQSPGSFDLLVTDYDMPEMNGVAFAQKILAERPGLPIVLCSGTFAPERASELTLSGIRDFIAKPWDRNALAASIRRHLDRPSSPTQ